MAKALDIDEFLSHPGPLFDVRSPGEFSHARIPGALSLPLFTDPERALVGTTYKQQGKDAAVLLGLRLTGPKLASFVEEAKQSAPHSDVRVHCWRGGMRSSSMAWLLELAGMRPVTLRGGYKAFRGWCGGQFEKPWRFVVIGGMTGSGKTEILHALRGLDEQVLDLEGLALHRGSAYGSHEGDIAQPSTEQFENDIATCLAGFDLNRPVWVEDESRLIGTCHVPHRLHTAMREAEFVALEMPRGQRIDRLCCEYGREHPERLAAATQRIAKQLGGVRTAQALEAIATGNIPMAASLVLDYYDAAYAHSMKKNPRRFSYAFAGIDGGPVDWARELVCKIKK